MKKLWVILSVLTGATLNGASAGSLLLRRGLQSPYATNLMSARQFSAAPTFMPEQVEQGSLLQANQSFNKFKSLFYKPLPYGDPRRMYGTRTEGATGNDYAGAGSDKPEYSSKRIAAFLGLTGLTLLAGKSELEDTQERRRVSRLYTTYTTDVYGNSVLNLLRSKGPNSIQNRLYRSRKPVQEASDLADLVAIEARKNWEMSRAIFVEPQTLSALTAIAEQSPEALAKVVDIFAKAPPTNLCCSDAQRTFIKRLIDADTDGVHAEKLTTLLFSPMLTDENAIPKVQKWQGGWFTGKYVATGEQPNAAHNSLLRILASKSPQAAQVVTDRLLLLAKLVSKTNGVSALPFFTIAYLVDISPYAAQKFAQELPESLFIRMVEAQNIAQETADQLWQKLQATAASGRIQE